MKRSEMVDRARLESAYERVCGELLAERTPDGHWEGELSTSALSTATAVSALSIVDRAGQGDPAWRAIIQGGVQYLASHQNADGGWGDTDRSYSNISTTMLAVAAFEIAGATAGHRGLLDRAEAYIQRQDGIAGLRRRYGRDKTFAVPILSNYALAGFVSWNEVSPLPFELACLPQRFYRFVRMPVVSYAIPALVAIGQSRYRHAPSRLPWMRWIRAAAVQPSLRVLARMQPDSGGYLEATPLTSFVVMNLAGSGQADHAVTRQGVKFLLDSDRPDGSWPIDTNLATWTTTLAVNALAAGGRDVGGLGCLDWLLDCQYHQRHPFTGADPGGWGWSDLSGSVPDADDTPGALLALAAWRDSPSCREADRPRLNSAAREGIHWLLNLQNSDGGWPTFCRGWGRLPFDRSGADLTAHVLRAMRAWQGTIDSAQIQRAAARGFRYLDRQQREDGSWLPLWFGNQDHPAEENPIYGTAKVLLAYYDCGRHGLPAAERGLEWLVQSQNPDGGWGGSVEETALAVETLAAIQSPSCAANLDRGVNWLLDAVDSGRHRKASPIGFYFAKLWYYEKLYPVIFTAAALGRVMQ